LVLFDWELDFAVVHLCFYLFVLEEYKNICVKTKNKIKNKLIDIDMPSSFPQQ